MRPGPSSTADLTAVIHLLLFSHLRTVIPLSLLQILRTTYIHPLLGPPPPPHHYTSVASTPFLQKNLLYSDSFSHGRFSAESQLAAAGAVARLGQDLAVYVVSCPSEDGLSQHTISRAADVSRIFQLLQTFL